MTATKTHKIDEISDKLAEQFIKALSKNILPWQKDWDISCIDPHNLATGTVYAGTSRYILMCEQNDKGYDDPRWLTFNNGKDLGSNERKREKGTTCIKFQPKKIAKLDENEKPVLNGKGEVETQEILMPIPHVVFNATQFNDLKLPPINSLEQKYNWSLDERAEHILKISGANIDISQRNEAFYNPSENKIYLPLREQFKSSEEVYKTALHELAHWTGHGSKLNRKNINTFGTQSYTKEELRAEIASSIISVKLGINTDITNNKAYIQFGLKRYKTHQER